MNIGALKSCRYRDVEEELRLFVKAAGPAVTKCILEVCYLTDEEIATACKLVAEAGKTAVVWPAADIKWTDSPAVKGAKVAVLWGDPKSGAYGMLKSLPAGSGLALGCDYRNSTHTHNRGWLSPVTQTPDERPSPLSRTFPIPGFARSDRERLFDSSGSGHW